LLNVVVAGVVTYLIVLALFRIAGHRQMAQKTPFDLALVLLVAQAAQYGLLGIGSLTQAGVLVVTLVGTDILTGILAQRFRGFRLVDEGSPVLLVAGGRALPDRLSANRISVDDILESGRESAGIERLEQIRYAVIEKSGQITIIPYERPGASVPA